MAIFSDPKCEGCPYRNQEHLQYSSYFVSRNSPLSKEASIANRRTLLVFQAPGVNEWVTGTPIQGNQSPSSSGNRIQNALIRIGKTRNDFHITNSVQCFPGKRINIEWDKAR